jgi:choline/glycine/proline betaine transport protein
LQAATLVAALPFALIMILLAVGLVRQMNADLAGVSVMTEAPPLAERVKRILAPARRRDIDAQLTRHGLPALEEVCNALSAEGVDTAEVIGETFGAALKVRHAAGRDFDYRLAATSRPLPAFSALDAPEGRRAQEWRLTAQAGSSRRRDVTGFTREQIVSDILAQLELWRRDDRHLAEISQ